MVRFSAPERDIEQMLRFLSRRLPGGVHLVPLLAAHRDELRWRRTFRPLVNALRTSDTPMAWGIREAAPSASAAASGEHHPPRLITSRDPETAALVVDPDASQLITLALGPAEGAERRRDALLLVRDWDLEAGPSVDAALTERAEHARSAVERTARHLRRSAVREGGRWILGVNAPDASQKPELPAGRR